MVILLSTKAMANQYGLQTLTIKERLHIILKCKKMAIFAFMIKTIKLHGHPTLIKPIGKAIRDSINKKLNKKVILSTMNKDFTRRKVWFLVVKTSGQKCNQMETLLSIIIQIINQIMLFGQLQPMEKGKDHIMWECKQMETFVFMMVMINVIGRQTPTTRERVLIDWFCKMMEHYNSLISMKSKLGILNEKIS